jgi:cell division protein FtsB
MKLFDRIPAWLRNKYVLTLIGFGIWMLFIDDRDFYVTYFKQRNELNALQTSKQYFEQQISTTRAELDQLKVNAATVEKYAREKYLMKRDNEDLFVVEKAQ